MSFVKLLGTLAVGFAAAKGMQKVKDMGGTDALRDKMRNAGEPGGMADDVAAMAQKLGLPIGQDQLRGIFAQFGGGAAGASETAEAGFGQLTGMMSKGVAGLGGMVSAMTAGTAMGEMSEENARLMIRAMIQAAKADGEIDADERTKILDQLDDASEEEIAFVQAELNAPIDVETLAADAQGSMKAQVYRAALMAVLVDTPAEKAYLQALASALGLDDAAVAEIHSSMGRPAL
ncbi:MAG: tellurite resistance TerB family protein [Paracoccaceae bacterium]